MDNTFDKETVMAAFEEAINNVKKEQEQENEMPEMSTEDIQDSEMMNNVETTDDSEMIEESNVDVDVKEAVDDKVEEAVDDLSGKFKFLDIDIDIKENEEPKDGELKYTVVLSKDDKEESYPSDDISLQSIFDLIDGFLQNMVLEEATEEVEDDDIADESNEDDDAKEDNDAEDLDSEDEESDEDKDEEEVVESSIVANELLSTLREKYADRVNAIFNQGIEASNIALDMVKDTILANSIKELLDKSKQRDVELSANKEELKEASQNYLLARNMNKNYTTFYNTLVANIKSVEDNLSKGLISKMIADKTLDRYSAIISKIVDAKQSKTIVAGIEQLDNTHNALLAHINNVNKKTKAIVSSKKIELDTVEEEIKKPLVSKKVISTIVAGNKLNDGAIGRHSLSEAHRRYDAIDEMTAEIVRIAGFAE